MDFVTQILWVEMSPGTRNDVLAAAGRCGKLYASVRTWYVSTTGITKFGFHDGGIGSEQMDTAFFISLTFFVTELVYNCINENKTRKSVHIKIFKFFFFG
jgi:hypothetical protein